jgi:hypothetical protein
VRVGIQIGPYKSSSRSAKEGWARFGWPSSRSRSSLSCR